MDLSGLLNEFSDDPGVRLVAALILLDLVFGVANAVKDGAFRFVYLADFLRNDVLGKVVPFFAVWAAVRVGGDIEVSGYGLIEEGVNYGVVAALGASVLNSLKGLGLAGLPEVVAADDPNGLPD
jgi:hypothetical protein